MDADACFAGAIITCEDWRACVARYKDDPRALIFLDPPYFNSFNQEYYGMDKVKTHPGGRIIDGTELFLEMLELLQSSAARVVVITNSCAIIDYIFRPFIRQRYTKAYSRCVKVDGVYVKKSTHHILLDGGATPLTAAEVAEQVVALTTPEEVEAYNALEAQREQEEQDDIDATAADLRAEDEILAEAFDGWD